jgi:hypothetical protein
MIRYIQSTLANLLKPKKYYQTFTYYCPAPPHRNTGYREKELDKYLSSLLSIYQIEKITTQAHQGTSSGMWVIVVVSTTDPKLKELNLNFPEQIQETIPGIEIIMDED